MKQDDPWEVDYEASERQSKAKLSYNKRPNQFHHQKAETRTQGHQNPYSDNVDSNLGMRGKANLVGSYGRGYNTQRQNASENYGASYMQKPHPYVARQGYTQQ